MAESGLDWATAVWLGSAVGLRAVPTSRTARQGSERELMAQGMGASLVANSVYEYIEPAPATFIARFGYKKADTRQVT